MEEPAADGFAERLQPQSTWRRSVVVSSDESSGDGGETGTRDNTDPRAR